MSARAGAARQGEGPPSSVEAPPPRGRLGRVQSRWRPRHGREDGASEALRGWAGRASARGRTWRRRGGRNEGRGAIKDARVVRGRGWRAARGEESERAKQSTPLFPSLRGACSETEEGKGVPLRTLPAQHTAPPWRRTSEAGAQPGRVHGRQQKCAPDTHWPEAPLAGAHAPAPSLGPRPAWPTHAGRAARPPCRQPESPVWLGCAAWLKQGRPVAVGGDAKRATPAPRRGPTLTRPTSAGGVSPPLSASRVPAPRLLTSRGAAPRVGSGPSQEPRRRTSDPLPSPPPNTTGRDIPAAHPPSPSPASRSPPPPPPSQRPPSPSY